MSIFKNRVGLALARKTRVFLLARRTKALFNRAADKILARQRPTEQEREIASRRAVSVGRGIEPESIVWIFGSGRTGSTWLSSMMGALPNHTRWDEPLVGYLFGHLYYERARHRQDKEHFILTNGYKEIWLNAARNLILDGGAARFPERTRGGYLVVKEPHGSLGAPLLMEAVPESRMVFLVRDPRDVVASALAVSSARKGGRDRSSRVEKATKRPKEFARSRASTYRQDIENTRRAFDAHEGPKVLVRYEDLRADTLGTLGRIYSTLKIPINEGEISWAIEKYSWESIPGNQKGEGTVHRKATPRGWAEDLLPEQIEIVEEETSWILDQFYGGDRYVAPE